MVCMGKKQLVHSVLSVIYTVGVRYSECPLKEVPLYYKTNLFKVCKIILMSHAPLDHQIRYAEPVPIVMPVDALCRYGTSEISRDPRTKRLQTRRESLARPSKHTNNNF